MAAAIPFLAMWSVGMSRIDALVSAANADEITSRFPELDVVPLEAALDHVPAERLVYLQARPPLSIEDSPTGLLEEIVAFRQRRQDVTWRSDFASWLLLFGPASPELSVSSVVITSEPVSVEVEVRGSLLPKPLIWRPVVSGYAEPEGAAIDLIVELMEAVESGRFAVGSDAGNRDTLLLPED